MSNDTKGEDKLFDVILQLLKVVNLLTGEVSRLNGELSVTKERLRYCE